MIVIKRKNLIIALVLVITILTFSLCFFELHNSNTDNADALGYKIVIDAGHGGRDNGVSGVTTGVKESELNLIISKQLEKYVVDAGFSAVLTRKTSAGLYGLATGNLKRKDMLKRKTIILEEKPTLVISIHMNKYSLSSRRGAQVFYKQGDKNSELLAKSIQSSLNSMEEAPRVCNALAGDYYILNCSNFPSVIVECGFLSNVEDERLLVSSVYQDKISYTIFKGIIEYFSKVSFNFCN